MHRLDRAGVVRADIEHDIVGAHCVGREQRTIDDEVWALLHQHSILAGQRLSLTTVGDHDRGSRTL